MTMGNFADGAIDQDVAFKDITEDNLLDRVWRLENLYWIKNKKGQRVKLKLNFCQRFLITHMHYRNVILKARQLGMSTFIDILILDECLFNEDKSCGIIADKVENAKKLFDKIDYAWSKFDEELKTSLGLTLESDSATIMRFSNGSSISVGATLHGGTYQILHVSEYGPLCARAPDKAEIVKKSGLPTVDQGGIIFIESTAEGEDNDFHEICVDAMDLQQKGLPLSALDYKFFFFAWFDNPEYQLEVPWNEDGSLPDGLIPLSEEQYFLETEKIIGKTLTIEQRYWYVKTHQSLKEAMKEQHPSYPEEAFLSSGNKMFESSVIIEKQQNEVRTPIRTEGNIVIFTDYIRGHMYGIGGDVALGIGRDSSTICVIDFTAGEVVATMIDKWIKPDMLAYEMAKLGRMYGVCIIAPENNNMGHTTVTTLHKIYPNLFTAVVEGYNEDKQTARLGFTMSSATKGKIMTELSAAFTEGSLKVPDNRILMEARSFNKEDALIVNKAEMTRHFDLLIACAIAWAMRAYTSVTWESPESKLHVAKVRQAVSKGTNNYN